MSFLEFNAIRIAGMSAGVPANVVQTVSTTDQYGADDFIAMTGIKEKRYSNSFTTSDLCLPAAEKLIEDLRWDKSEIGALVFVLFCSTKFGWGFDKYIEETNTGAGLKLPHWLKWYFILGLPILTLVILVQGL